MSAVSGWSLTAISEMDLHHPGFAGHFLRASVERRQVIAAFLVGKKFVGLARGSFFTEATDLSEVAEFLCTANHTDMLREAFGEAPAGLRGALKRSGSQVHEPRFYMLLVHLLHGRRRPDLAKAVQRLDTLSLRKLEIACVLSTDLLHPDLIGRLRDRVEARNVAAAIGLLQSHVIDKQAFAKALQALRRRGDMQDFFGKWILRCEFARSPIPATAVYRPIEDGPTLSRIALEYRNCSRTYAADLLEGTASFAEFVTNRGSAIIYLVKRDGAWFFDEVYAHRNRDVDPAIRSRAIEYLRPHGVFERRVSAAKLTPHGALKRFLPRVGWL